MSTTITDTPRGNNPPPRRVAVYVDGLNLYHGLKAQGLRRFYWLDLRQLAERLLIRHQRLALIRYYTALFETDANNPGRRQRQNTYLKALETLPDLTIHYGHHLPKTVNCRSCGATWKTFEEKMTDVNIAVSLLQDAMHDAFDTAIVISADSDLVGPIDAVQHNYPEKRVVVAFPPNRHSEKLSYHANATLRLWHRTIARSQFPPQVIDANGYVLDKPERWN